MNDPYQIIHARRMTEKSLVLEGLVNAKSNKSLARCDQPKFVFDVARFANKTQIAQAIEQIFPGVKVVKVNTVTIKGKKRRVKGYAGETADYKKAIVTLRSQDKIEVGG